MQPQLASAADEPTDNTPAPPRWWAPLLSSDLWIAVGAITVALVIAAGGLFVLWLILKGVFHLIIAAAGDLTHGGSWLATGPVARIVTGPVHSYLQIHDSALPATTAQLWWTWLVASAVLLAFSCWHSVGARIGWTLLGAVTTAMVWAGAAPDSRYLAAGIAVLAWSLLSIPAFSLTSRDRPIVLPDRPAIDSTETETLSVPRAGWARTAVTATAGVRLQWGVLTTAPSGASICTVATSQFGAISGARTGNKARPGSAQLIYREVSAGDWCDDVAGDEFGVRYQWPDGHTEVQEASDRYAAESLARRRRADGVTALVVSQSAVYGEWLMADTEAAAAF